MCDPMIVRNLYFDAAARLGLEPQAYGDGDVTVVFERLHFMLLNHAPSDPGFLSVVLPFQSDDDELEIRQSAAAAVNRASKGVKAVLTEEGHYLVAECVTAVGEMVPLVGWLAMVTSRLLRMLVEAERRFETELVLAGVAAATDRAHPPE